jgi:hypothetical protein
VLTGTRTPGAPRVNPFAVAADITEEALKRARRRRWVTAVLAVLAGGGRDRRPGPASVTITLFVGWILVFTGIVTGVHGSRSTLGDASRCRSIDAVLTPLVGHLSGVGDWPARRDQPDLLGVRAIVVARRLKRASPLGTRYPELGEALVLPHMVGLI